MEDSGRDNYLNDIKDDRNNNEESKCESIDTYTSPSSSSVSESESDDVDSAYNDSLCALMQRMQSAAKGDKLFLQIPGKIDPKYYSKQCIKNTEIGRSIPVPPTHQKVVLTTDSKMNDGCVILTTNRASKIFYAIAAAVFHSSAALMASHVKLMYLKQIERDYNAAKKSNDSNEIRKCIRLINKAVLEYDEPWFEEEWLIASKAFFAPIHILYNCSRVPSNPHIVQYKFSPVLDDEPPIRIVVDNGD